MMTKKRLERIEKKKEETNKLKRKFKNPMTGDRHYNDEEFEFLKECDKYRTQYRKPFLEACEYLHILKSLGYRK